MQELHVDLDPKAFWQNRLAALPFRNVLLAGGDFNTSLQSSNRADLGGAISFLQAVRVMIHANESFSDSPMA